MKATESLEIEHRKIAKVAEACGVFADELQQGTRVPVNVLEALVNFLHLYAEQYHHQEEEWLFSMLRQRGLPAGTYPMAALLREDDKLSALVHQLSNGMEVYARTERTVDSALVDSLHSLAELYCDHIWKENYLLLPMADKILSDSDQQALVEAFCIIKANVGQKAYRSLAQLSGAIKSCMRCSDPQEQGT